jgi:hypothetical protein
MQSSNKNGEQGGEELSGIQRQINQTTNESLESTRRMLGLVIESEEVGNKTMVMLDQQGEKLDQIEVKKFFFFLLNFFLNYKIRLVLIIFIMIWVKLKKI